MDNDKPNNKQPLVSFIVTYHNEPMTNCLNIATEFFMSDKQTMA